MSASRPLLLRAAGSRRPARPSGDVVAAYVGLTKPRVIELLLLTTVPVMFFAARGVPPLGLVVATVVGGTLSAGSASAPQLRLRPRHRRADAPYPPPGAAAAHRLAARGAGLRAACSASSRRWCSACWVNWLSAGLAVLANAFYVFVYTMVLKRRTTQNIVWGGLAGCFPALIGWTAVTGELAWAPVVLFVVVFFWTPPHTWALALRYREDYAQRRRADAAGRRAGRRSSAARSCSTAG